jgi:hypothetical protein
MITPEQIDELYILSDKLMDDVIEAIMQDVIKSVKAAGSITSSDEYRIWLLKTYGVDDKKIKDKLQKMLDLKEGEIDSLIDKAAESSYMDDVVRLGSTVAFSDNEQLQQLIAGIKEMCHADFKNITGTMGFIGKDGTFSSLTRAYHKASDFAFKEVAAGALDYDTAILEATRNLINEGIKTINYESGIMTEVGAAVRRNVMSSVGNLTNEISEMNHEDLGCTGWEISAHAMCAPDHESIQGKQFSDKEWERIDEGLKRHIGTLNCGHTKFPVFIGKSKPVHTSEELNDYKKDNSEGDYYKGVHYTGYEATQKQREIERRIRQQNRKVNGYKMIDNKEMLEKAKTRRQQLYTLYNDFSKSTELRPQYNRFK